MTPEERQIRDEEWAKGFSEGRRMTLDENAGYRKGFDEAITKAVKVAEEHDHIHFSSAVNTCDMTGDCKEVIAQAILKLKEEKT